MSLRSFAIVATAAAGLLAGCNLAGPNRNYDAELAHYKQVAGTVDHPQLTTPPSDNLFTPQPRTIDHNAAPQQPQEWWEMSIEEALQTALARSSVLRDLGGTVIRSPDSTRTILGPSLIATEPRFGMEAALSEFDATLATSVVAEKNDRMINNFVASGGTRFFQQDLINFQSQLTKVGVAGTRMTLRGISTYDNNNASFNRFPSVWDTLYEAEIRQPLYQGAGARFNRLAGPNSVPGFYNGVLIARVNTDISVADFEIGLRDLVSNVENAYWDLYFAYRDLDAKLQVRNASLEAWKKIKVALEQGQPEGTPEREAQAREQYFRYEEDVQNALAGSLQASTTNNNGSSGGSFRGLGGVLVSERRLRLAIGLPITDGRMIRPADEPTAAQVMFDWPTASDDAIARRPELLRQRLAVKRREMEFVAARNFLLPRFDLIGRYRVRGLGKGLIGDVTLPPDPVGDPQGLFENSSLGNLALANFQEWQLGGEVSLPIGFRRGHAAVRNAQLFVAREKAVLEEQERQVIHDLSNALGDAERAYQVMQTSYNRRRAAQEHVVILRTKIEKEQTVTPEQLLEAERRLAEADTQYHKALVEHMLAIKNVHFEKGSLLEYGHILLSEQVSIVNSRPPASDANQQPTPAPVPPPPENMPGPPPPPPGGPALPQEAQHPGPPPVLASPPPAALAPAVPGAQPILGGLPPQNQAPQVQPPPQAPLTYVVPPPRSASEAVAPSATEGLPPAPAQAPVMPPPPPPAMQGLPPLARAAGTPLLQWSRPAPASFTSIPVDPFPAPAQALPQQQPTPQLPPAQQQPPMPQLQPTSQPQPTPQPPPQPQPQPSPQVPPRAAPLEPAVQPSTRFIEQLWYSRDPAYAPRPAAEIAVPVQAPIVPPQPAAWQPPVTPPPAVVIPQPAYQPPPPQQSVAPPQPVVWQPPVGLPPRVMTPPAAYQPLPPQQSVAPPPPAVWQPPMAAPPVVVIPPAYQPLPPQAAATRLPRPEPELPAQRLPATGPQSPEQRAQRLPQAVPETPPAVGQRLPPPEREPQLSRLPTADGPHFPTNLLP